MGGRREKVLAPSPKPSTLSVPCHFLSAHSQDEEMYCSVALPRLVSICLFTFVCLFVYRSWRRQMGDWTASVTRETSACENTTKGNFLFTKIANVEQASKSKRQHFLKKKKPVITYYFDAIVFNIMIRLLGAPLHILQLRLKNGVLLLITLKFCKL